MPDSPPLPPPIPTATQATDATRPWPVVPPPAASGRYVGIDFSGARDAGRRIWVAEGRRLVAGGLVLEACRPACELPGSAVERSACMEALVRWLRSLGPATVGIDLPFSLPVALQQAPDYLSFLRQFAIQAETDTADAFRERCRALSRANLAATEARRACEVAAGAPFSAWNLRLYRQTWHGLRELLVPLLTAPSDPFCVAVPYQRPPADGEALVLLEACPATWLQRQGLYAPYKGTTAAHRRHREVILAQLLETGLRLSPPSTDAAATAAAAAAATAAVRAERILGNAGGDALDSVIALAIAWQPTVPAESLTADAELLRREGCVYG